MIQAISETKKMIENHLNELNDFNVMSDFSKYSPAILFTNENIKGYLEYAKLSKNSDALTVLASGDQAFNLITKGVRNIDAFDINYLTEYFALGIKRAMILKYDYQDFLEITYKLISGKMDLITLSDFVVGLFSFMEKEHRDYWQAIIDFNFHKQRYIPEANQLNLFNMICYKCWSSLLTSSNNYLENETKYNYLRNNIAKSNITFRYANAANLSKYFDKKYDVVLMSNIMDYLEQGWKSEPCNYIEIFEYSKRMKKLLKQNHQVFLAYIFNYEENKFDYPGIEKFNQKNNASIISFKSQQRYIDDGVVLIRK